MYDLLIFIALLAIGYGTGRYAEHRHYQSILQREDALRRIPVVATKRAPWGDPVPESYMVSGSVVISVDYFKRFVAGLRTLVGGRITTYETLLDRARREAILRMKEQAKALGGHIVFNVKVETSSISKGRKNTVGSVEVLAYGTAFVNPA